MVQRPVRVNDSLAPLLDTHRVILCVGSGGVGKTTTTAALGLAAATRGRRVLCLTIDPARRLAQSLGLEQLRADAQVVGRDRFAQAHLDVPGELTVMMLDTKRTFDQIVDRYAASPEARDRILNNRMYQYVSTALSGTREYMAMEKLYEVKNDPRFDIIILDTPPTSHALDFLDAPERLIDALDSSAMRWFVKAFQSTGKLSFNVLARSAAMALRGLGRITGRGFLEEVAEFVSELHHLFGGFTERAREVQAALRGEDVAYVLVTSPSPMAIREVVYFAERLASLHLPSDAFVINRVHVAPGATYDVDEIARAIAHWGIELDEDAPIRLRSAVRDEAVQAALDAHHLTILDRALDGGAASAMRIRVPAFPYDVHDLASLDEVAKILMGRSAP